MIEILIILLIVIILWMECARQKQKYLMRSENFEGRVYPLNLVFFNDKIDLKDFLDFMEYFQNVQLDQHEKPHREYYREVQAHRISYEIQNIFNSLTHLVTTDYYKAYLTDLSTHLIPINAYERTVYNNYTYESVDVNVVALFELLKDQQNTESTSAEQEQEQQEQEQTNETDITAILKSMTAIINTDILKDYLHEQKFKVQYSTLIFNPLLINV